MAFQEHTQIGHSHRLDLRLLGNQSVWNERHAGWAQVDIQTQTNGLLIT